MRLSRLSVTLIALPLLALGACGDGGDAIARIDVSSSSFVAGGPIPSAYSCDGENQVPTLIVDDVPSEAKSLVLLMDDMSTRQNLVHWMVWDIPSAAAQINELTLSGTGVVVGQNGFDAQGYVGPCPPKGEGMHRYQFQVYALDTLLGQPSPLSRDELKNAMKGHVVGKGVVVGTYTR